MGLIMTLIELIGGWIGLKNNVKLWDYSDQWGNYKGIICPLFSAIWTAAGALYYYLSFQFKNAVQNFKNGMSKVINMDILRLYTGEELRQIIYGFDKDVFTVGDMQLNSNFIGFDMQNPKEAQCINDFLKILDEFTQTPHADPSALQE